MAVVCHSSEFRQDPDIELFVVGELVRIEREDIGRRKQNRSDIPHNESAVVPGRDVAGENISE